MKMKKLTALILALTAAVGSLALLSGCSDGGNSAGKSAPAAEKAKGFVSTGTYQEYTDLGGYGSDFVMVNYSDLTLYEDNTFTMNAHYFNFAPAWSIIASEDDSTITGTYTVVTEDEFGIKVDLTALRVRTKSVAGGTVFTDTNDVNSFIATEDKTADQLCADALAAYTMSGVEIDYEGNNLILPQ